MYNLHKLYISVFYQISAEEHIPPEIILVRLESLDKQLRLLEEEGRQLEIKLRECEYAVV